MKKSAMILLSMLMAICLSSCVFDLPESPNSEHICSYDIWFYEGGHCKKCECGNVIRTEEHKYGEWNEIVNNCLEHSRSRTCTLCNVTQTENLPVSAQHRPDGDVCSVCGRIYYADLNVSSLDKYNGFYGYKYLGTMQNGEYRQQLYREIDRAVREFHTSEASAGANYKLSEFNFARLGLSVQDAVAVYKTYKDDNPLYYWLSNSVSVTVGGDFLTVLVDEEYALGSSRKETNKLVYDKVNDLMSALSKGDSAYRIALYLHDAIIQAIDYTYDESGEPSTASWAHSILGVLTEQGGVCEAYAKAFQLLLNYAGVENVFVTGDLYGGAHAWNIVRLEDGRWYWCDLTLDDDPDWTWGIKYNWFCVNKNSNTVMQDYGWNYDKTEYFSDSHKINKSNGEGVYFLYDLPNVSTEDFNFDGVLRVGDKFDSGKYELKVVGFNAAQVCSVVDSGKVEIPASVTLNNIKYSIISLGNNASPFIFEDIKEVVIPESVKFIEDNAFMRADTLENIKVDENNKYFRDLDGVLFTKSLYTLIAYPSANSRKEYVVPDETHDIAHNAFDRCSYLATLTLGKNTEGLGRVNWGTGYPDGDPVGPFGGNYVVGGLGEIYNALTGEKNILIHSENRCFYRDGFAIFSYDKENLLFVDRTVTKYQIPQSVQYIGFDAFAGCDLLQSIDIPDSVIGMSGHAFRDCKNLANVTIGKGIKSISFGTFSGCDNLKNVTIGNNIERIDDFAFVGCLSLEEIVIPDSVTYIGDCAFSDCESLQSIEIPQNVAYIGYCAFSRCKSLKFLVIHKGVKHIGANIMLEAYDGVGITFIGTQEEWAQIDIDEKNADLFNNRIFYYPQMQ
ncbi:MAG: leucine-rich repeat protein [Clostridiales bacterium]|nr:leucine-rich repeat protein [Clostridiales bacterium]